MKKKAVLAIIMTPIVICLVAAPQKAFGQGNTWTGRSVSQMVEAARWRLDILRINAALNLLNVGYDSDLYYGYLSEPVPDATFSAALPLQVLIPISKSVVLDLFENPQYVFYLDTKKERALNNTSRGAVHLALKKFYFQAGGGLANVRRRLSPELDINIREKANRLNGLALWQVSQKMSLAMAYRGSRFDYGDAAFGGTTIADTLNRKEAFADLVSYLQLSPRVRLFLDGQYGRYAFPDRDRDAQSYGVFGGFEFTAREGEIVEAMRFQGSANLGYMSLDLKNPLLRDGSGLSGIVNLSAGLSRKTMVRTYYSRGFEFSVYSGASYFIGTSYGGGIAQRLSPRVSLSYDLAFGLVDYPRGEAGEVTFPGYRYTTHTANLSVMFRRNLTVTFFGTFGQRRLGPSGEARSRNFLGLNLSFGAPMGTVAIPMGGVVR